MTPWRARAVPRQAPGTTRTPRKAKNGVGRLPHEEAADAVVKEKEPQPLVTSIGMPGPMVVVMVALRM